MGWGLIFIGDAMAKAQKRSFRGLPKGQQRAHVNMAVTNLLRRVGGNVFKINETMIANEASRLGVPEADVRNKVVAERKKAQDRRAATQLKSKEWAAAKAAKAQGKGKEKGKGKGR